MWLVVSGRSNMPSHLREVCSDGVALVDYGRAVEREIAHLQALIETNVGLAGHFNSRWLAIKLLEDDQHIVSRVRAVGGAQAILEAAQESVRRLEDEVGDEADVLIADRRYAFISHLVHEAVIRPAEFVTLSDRIDKVVTHRLLGLPIFAIVMWVMFQMTANVSGFYLDWVDGVIGGPITRWGVYLIRLVGMGGTWVESLVVDGIIAGVGGVMVFVPVLLFLYFFIALLEDSGYMARAAFVMDDFMRSIGLQGKSFIPMLVGFGCSVPGIYATRTLDSEEDRILTALLVPFMSCSARLPVYVILGVAFFGERSGALVFAMYALGVVVAIAMGLLFRHTLFRDKPQAPFVMELPPYRLPTLKGILIPTWERTWEFVRKAWTVILAVSIIIWLLSAMPVGAPGEQGFADMDAGHSALAAVSRALAPIFVPAGYGTWQATSSLMTGFIAKEVIVSTMSQVYVGGEQVEIEQPTNFIQDLGEIATSFLAATWDTVRGTFSLIPGVNLFGEEGKAGEDPALVAALQGTFTPLSAVAFCVFVLLYTPCMVSITALWQEFGARWALFTASYVLVLAWLLSVITYQGGLWLGFG
jgi:ferrous iron transport protein B